MLTDITKARATFDTSMAFKQFGPIIIHFEHVRRAVFCLSLLHRCFPFLFSCSGGGWFSNLFAHSSLLFACCPQVRDKVNHKYDSWHKELLGKFAGMLSGRVRGLRDTMATWRSQLEAVAFDSIAPFEIATPITTVQQSVELLSTWQEDWHAFAEGEKLLLRQRYALPAEWLMVSNLEGEWQAVNQVSLRRKDDMSARMSTLRSQVSAADAVMTENFNKLAGDWERERCVLCCGV